MIASPPQEIKITGATVFVNPYEELLEEEAKKEEAKRKAVSYDFVLLSVFDATPGSLKSSPAVPTAKKVGADARY